MHRSTPARKGKSSTAPTPQQQRPHPSRTDGPARPLNQSENHQTIIPGAIVIDEGPDVCRVLQVQQGACLLQPLVPAPNPEQPTVCGYCGELLVVSRRPQPDGPTPEDVDRLRDAYSTTRATAPDSRAWDAYLRAAEECDWDRHFPTPPASDGVTIQGRAVAPESSIPVDLDIEVPADTPQQDEQDEDAYFPDRLFRALSLLFAHARFDTANLRDHQHVITAVEDMHGNLITETLAYLGEHEETPDLWAELSAAILASPTFPKRLFVELAKRFARETFTPEQISECDALRIIISGDNGAHDATLVDFPTAALEPDERGAE